jgi:signal transduction histidine kinase
MSPARADLIRGLAGAAFGAGIAATTQGVPDVITGGLLGAALAGARSHPRATWVLAAAIILTAAARQELPGGDPFAAYLLVAAHSLSAGRCDSGWYGVGGLVAITAASGLSALTAHESGIAFLFICGAAWGAGRVLRDREEVAARLAERARELEAEREAHAALSVRYERARIASELHDIVAHAISVMVVQASAGQRLAAHDPELTAETFANLASAASQAEADLGRLVALLADQHAIGDAPNLSLVEELIAHAAGSGLDITLRLEGEREGVPAASAELAYRIVQEGITNALRYAAGSAVTVIVRGDRDALAVRVKNDPSASDAALVGVGTGNGLRGLRERVGARGGTLEAGPTADGGWQLSARLPRRVTEQARPAHPAARASAGFASRRSG